MRLTGLFASLLLLVLTTSPAALQAQTAETTITDDSTGQTYRIDEYSTANFPVGMAFADDGRLFYNEKTTGSVRVITAEGDLLPEPVITLPTNALQERGMLGLALAPDFAESQMMYVMHTREGTTRDFPANRLVRFRITDENQADPDSLEELWRVPIENGLLLHNGGNIHFDENGYLFLSLGDYGEAANAQNLETPQGALHRFEVTDEGIQPAPDNPFGDDNSIFAYGLRNAFDFAIDPLSKRIYASESGPDCDDEINVILAGFNYGWGEDYECVGTDYVSGLDDIYGSPLLTFTPPIAPTGIIVYDGDAFPEWQGDVFFCDWVRGQLTRIELDDDDRTQMVATHAIDLGEATCRIDLVVSPDGELFFGDVGEGSGVIWRLRPAES